MDLDAPAAYVDSVYKSILAQDPSEVENLEEVALVRAAHYLWWNGYKSDEGLYHSPDDGPETSTAYFAYDVLKWVDQNM